MITIDGPLWFAAALVIWVLHALHHRSWRRDQREYRAWREAYSAREEQRHEEIMRVMAQDEAGWRLDGSQTRGQA